MSSGNHLQDIADTTALDLGPLIARWQQQGLHASDQTARMFADLYWEVAEAFALSVRAVRGNDARPARRVSAMKDRVTGFSQVLSGCLSERLLTDDPDRLEIYRLETEVIEVFKCIYYFAKRIAKSTAERWGKAEPRMPPNAAHSDG